MEFVTLNEKEFASFTKKYPLSSFMQTIELGHLKEHQGLKVHYVGVREGKKIVAATLMEEHPSILGKTWFYAPRGLLVDYHDTQLLTFFTEELKKYIKERKGFRLIIDPNYIYRTRSSEGDLRDPDDKDDEAFQNLISLGYVHFGFNKYLEAMQVRYAYRLKLDKPYEEIKKTFSKSTRKNMDSCYKKGLRVRKGTIDDLPIMEELFENTARRKEFFFRDLAYYKEMYQYMGNLMTIYIAYVDPKTYLDCAKEQLKNEEDNYQVILKKMETGMVGAKLKSQKETGEHLLEKYKEEVNKAKQFKKDYPEGKSIGCLLSLRSGNEYLTLTSGSLAEYHSFTPKYALYDQHIQDAYQEGFKACNFYGISGNFTKENNPFYGLYEFKKGFGGEVIEYIGQFTLPVTGFNSVYNFLKKFKK